MRTILLASTFALLTACTQSNQNASPADTASDGGMGTPATQPLTCIGILDCAAKCTADACANDCIAKGSTDAQSDVTKLAQCYQNNMCTDGACAQSKCKSELDTCQAQSTPAPAGQPTSGSKPTGNVPASLVGRWTYTSPGGTSNELDFNADGTASYSTIQQSSGTCTLTSILSYTGPAVTDESAATVTIYGDGLLTQTSCGSTAKTPQGGRTVRFGYSLGMDDTGPRLLMKDLDCIDKNGDASYCYANYSKG